MRKTLLALSLLVASCVGAITPEFQWGKTLVTPGKTNSINQIEILGDGYLMIAGYKAAASISWGDVDLSFDQGNAASDDNLLIAALDKNGSIKWTITSTEGNFTTNNTTATLMPDGGFIVLSIVRRNSDSEDKLIATVVDAKGANHSFEAENKGLTEKYGVIMKFSADGAMQWSQLISQSNTYGAQSEILDGFTMSNAAVDAEGNFYVGGRYLAGLSLPGGINVPAGLNAPETVGKNVSVGDIWLAKFNAQGNATALYYSAMDNSAAFAADVNLQRVLVSKGTVYVAMTAKGLEGKTARIFGKDIALNKLQQPIVAAIPVTNSDKFASADYVKAFEVKPSSKETNMVNISNLMHIDGVNYICGRNTGTIVTDAGNIFRATADNTQGGYFIGYNPSDASALYAGYTGEQTIITDFVKLIVDSEAKKAYSVGYGLSSGFQLEEFNLGEAAPSVAITKLITSPGSFGIPCGTFDGESHTLVGGARTNKQVAFYGTSEVGANVTAFSANLAAYTIPEISVSGVESVVANASSLPDAIYNLQGVRVENPSKGIFIKVSNGKATKVLVK